MTMAAWSPDTEADGIRLSRRMRRPPGRRRVLLTFAALCAMVVGYLAGGFLRFTEEVSLLSRPGPAESADGIVVLTGGALRIDQAIDLLTQGRGRRLLISGVNPDTSAKTLARMTGTDPSWFDCCVDIDRAALTTVGNAEIASRWAREHGFQDLILVTSDYHMPRSLREFARIDTLRSVTPYAVRRNDLWRANQLPNGVGARVLVTEYIKLVAARASFILGLGQPDAVSTQIARIDP
ncbi:MAG TPA: YdcF family protein [Aurantimonas coralicida]|uniref:YdcF family protein n=2 Tax=root TaxID=1 RepID=A0A9C9TIZ8_9HYPH|nr:YdcF family protein [Aurantimonas coralicida]HEU02358.1 YdcF family protein [Aurantimonas coralicida]